MAEPVKTKRKTPGRLKANVSQFLPQAKGFIEKGEPTAETRPRMAQLKASLQGQLESLRMLDAEILRGLVEQEGVTDEDIAEEVQIAGNLKREIEAIITNCAPTSEPTSREWQRGHKQQCTCKASPARGQALTAVNHKVAIELFGEGRFGKPVVI